MLRDRRAPRCNTDSTFFAGVGTLANQFKARPQVLEQMVKNAKAHGYTPNVNDFYNPTLANFQGDPEAFIPASGGRGYVRALCEKRGTGCEGAVTVKARDAEPPPPKIRLAADLVAAKLLAHLTKHPEDRRKPRRELESMIVEKHGSK